MNEFTKDGFYFKYDETLSPLRETFQPHIHGEYELFFFLGGDLDYIVGESVYRLRQYDLLVIRPAVYHYPRIRSDERYLRIVVNFPPHLFPASLLSREIPTRIGLAPSGRIARCFFDAANAVTRFTEEDFTSALLHLLNMIFLYFKYDVRQEAEQTEIIRPLLGEILHYIDDNLCSSFSLEELSRRFFISPSWLTHTFRKELHIGVMQYITRKKILYAQSLIRSGTPPTEAAKYCTLGDYSTFYRQYKRLLGVSPKEETLIAEKKAVTDKSVRTNP